MNEKVETLVLTVRHPIRAIIFLVGYCFLLLENAFEVQADLCRRAALRLLGPDAFITREDDSTL